MGIIQGSLASVVATGALAGAAGGAIMTGTLKGALKGALFGAVSAGVAYGIGGALGHGGGSIFAKGFKPVKGIVKALSHGLSRGIIARAQGGTFRSGFASGFAASFFSPGTTLGGNGAEGFTLRTTVAAVVGGTASEIGGGKFANGAISGAFVHMFNAEGNTIAKAFQSLTQGFYNIGDYVARITGFRDWQNGSVVLKNYYRKQAMQETKAVLTLGKHAVMHPKITIKAISIYNQLNQDQVNMNVIVNSSVGLVVPAAGIISFVGNTMESAHQINEIYIDLRN